MVLITVDRSIIVSIDEIKKYLTDNVVIEFLRLSTSEEQRDVEYLNERLKSDETSSTIRHVTELYKMEEFLV